MVGAGVADAGSAEEGGLGEAGPPDVDVKGRMEGGGTSEAGTDRWSRFPLCSRAYLRRAEVKSPATRTATAS